MSDFDTLLKRSFAEAHEPADDGFAAHVSHVVARNERGAQVRNAVQSCAFAVAGAVVLYAFYGMALQFGPDFLASVGFGVARARSTVGEPAMDMWRTANAVLPQILLVTGALVGGAVAYRATQE